jgi:hypothetical protein
MRLVPPVRSLFAVALLAALAPSAHAQSTTFTDGTFSDVDWSVTVETLNLGGTAAGAQVATGGNPGSWRQIDNTLNSAVGQSFSNTVYDFHAKAGATFSPASYGPITSIDYAESSLRTAGAQQACGLALRQNGVIYYGPAFLNPAAFNAWAPNSQTGLAASTFDALAAGTQNPNFGIGAPPVQFGFYRANSTSVGGAGGTTSGGIDDWSVVVHFNGATALAATSWGRVKGLYR